MLSDNKFRNPLEIFSDRFKERERELSAGGGEFNTGTWFSGPTGGFASFQYTIPNFKGIRFSAEYDSTDYDLEGFPDGRNSFKFAFEPVRRSTSNINYGLMFPVNNSLQLKLGYMKGNTISFGFSLHANLGKQNPIFKKIITIPIENEKGTLNNNKLYQIALKNNITVNKANSFNEALKKISSKEKKLIVCFGSLYNAGNILNKN